MFQTCLILLQIIANDSYDISGTMWLLPLTVTRCWSTDPTYTVRAAKQSFISCGGLNKSEKSHESFCYFY